MEELIKTIKQYKGIAINASAVLMFIFFGFGSVLDVMGKVQMNGLNLLFNIFFIQVSQVQKLMKLKELSLPTVAEELTP